jgi:hypothetical protein
MKNSTSALNMPILVLATLVFLAGCAGLSGTPASNPTPAQAAHGTFVFVTGVATDGYRLNPEGSLTPIPGAPFPITGDLSASGSLLMIADGKSLTSYKVDPASGRPIPAASIAIQFADTLAADQKNVYVSGITSNFDLVLHEFSVENSGALTPLPDSPYMYRPSCGMECPMPILARMAVNNSFFAVAEIGFHGAGDVVVISRDSNGALKTGHAIGFEDQDSVALPHPGGNILFSSDSNLIGLTSYLVDSFGNPTPVTSLNMDTSFPDEVVDATGKFLLALDSSGVVHVFALDSATAMLSPIGTSEPAGAGAIAMAMDPSGHFVIVAQSSAQALSAPPNQITVFTFDPASGAMKKLQSYPVSKSPGHIAIVAE